MEKTAKTSEDHANRENARIVCDVLFEARLIDLLPCFAGRGAVTAGVRQEMASPRAVARKLHYFAPAQLVGSVRMERSTSLGV